MADTEHPVDPDTQKLFDAIGQESTPETREKARQRLSAARERMSAPGAWDRLREAHRARTA